jgi:two-component system NarL family sensor kinase
VVLRVAQEALRNVRKHAGAHRVALRTAEGEDGWRLEVADDGSGFDVPDTLRASAGRSFGLRFMRERAESIGAALAIDSGSTGTRVRLTITPDGERSSAW